MKVVLYMAMSVDGFITNKNNETPWSDEEWESFSKFVKNSGNLIIGRRTYEIMKKNNEFEKLENPLTVVVSSNEIKNQGVVWVKSPREAISLLIKRGFSLGVVAGGASLNSSFLKENLMNEIYLDIEPIIFGKGIKLFSEDSLDFKLSLLDVKKLSKNTIQLHYKVN